MTITLEAVQGLLVLWATIAALSLVDVLIHCRRVRKP